MKKKLCLLIVLSLIVSILWTPGSVKVKAYDPSAPIFYSIKDGDSPYATEVASDSAVTIMDAINATNNSYSIGQYNTKVIDITIKNNISSNDRIIVPKGWHVRIHSESTQYTVTDTGSAGSNGFIYLDGTGSFNVTSGESSKLTLENIIIESDRNHAIMVDGGLLDTKSGAVISCGAINRAGICVTKDTDINMADGTQIVVPDNAVSVTCSGEAVSCQQTASIYIETPWDTEAEFKSSKIGQLDSCATANMTIWNMLDALTLQYDTYNDHTFSQAGGAGKNLQDRILGKSLLVTSSYSGTYGYQLSVPSDQYAVNFKCDKTDGTVDNSYSENVKLSDGAMQSINTTMADFAAAGFAPGGYEAVGWGLSSGASVAVSGGSKFTSAVFDPYGSTPNRYLASSVSSGPRIVGGNVAFAYYIKYGINTTSQDLFAVYRDMSTPPSGGYEPVALEPEPDPIVTRTDTTELTIDTSAQSDPDTPVEIGREYLANVDPGEEGVLRFVASGAQSRKDADDDSKDGILADEYDPDSYEREALAVTMNVGDIPSSVSTLQFEVGAQTVDIPTAIAGEGSRIEVRIKELAEEAGEIVYEKPGRIETFAAGKKIKTRVPIYNTMEVKLYVDDNEVSELNGVVVWLKTKSQKPKKVDSNHVRELSLDPKQVLTNIYSLFAVKPKDLRRTRVPSSVTSPVWVNLDEKTGAVKRVRSRAQRNSETGEYEIVAELEHLSVYGIMEEADAEEMIYSQMIESGETDKFMIKVKTLDDRHKITWDPMVNVDFFRVYAAKEGGKFKKVKDVDRFDFLTYTRKNTGDEVWKYKVAAFKDGKKVATSVTVYGVCDKSGRLPIVNSLRFHAKKKVLAQGEKYTLKPEAILDKAVLEDDYNKLIAEGIKFFTTNTMVAKVSKTGRITAVNAGECEVYAFAANGTYAKINIIVSQRDVSP